MRYIHFAALLPLFLSACQSGFPAEVVSLPAPDDPDAQTRQLAPANYLADYTHREPVQPAPWRRVPGTVEPGDGQ